MKKLCLTIVGGFIVYAASAQNQPDKATLKAYRKNPVWVQMMNDPNTNYNEAVAAFDEFWRGKPEPEEVMRGEREEGESERQERSFLSRLFKSEAKEEQEILQYAEEYKRFTFWRQQNAGYVKPDGKVMSPEEQQALLEQELRNRQNTSK